jgi:sensory rhodopsin
MELIVEYSFLIAFVGMATATLYFILERSELKPEHKSTATIGALITFIAAINYYYMRAQIADNGVNDFPTELRYIDWILTTPLLLIKFPILLGLKNSSSLITRLVIADVAMIVLGYLGEVDLRENGATSYGIIMFILSCVAWLFIIYTLYATMSKSTDGKSAAVKNAFNNMKLFVVIGWAIYPIGYIIAYLGADLGLLRELVYTYADLINKVGFALVALSAVKVATSAAKEK